MECESASKRARESDSRLTDVCVKTAAASTICAVNSRQPTSSPIAAASPADRSNLKRRCSIWRAGVLGRRPRNCQRASPAPTAPIGTRTLAVHHRRRRCRRAIRARCDPPEIPTNFPPTKMATSVADVSLRSFSDYSTLHKRDSLDLDDVEEVCVCVFASVPLAFVREKRMGTLPPLRQLCFTRWQLWGSSD
uniref:Uncharacterized protein n=1 Tax=Plectus sambesii TaxID=2011161 RepID=A0A914VSJ5_9BILA